MNTVKAEGYPNYAYSLQGVRELDRWLVSRYGIDCFTSVYEEREACGRLASEADLEHFDDDLEHFVELSQLYKEQTSLDSEEADSLAIELTNLYSGDALRSWWHSRRRAWTMDSISVACAILEEILREGGRPDVLDIGCNIGVLPTFLSDTFGVHATGIDCAATAITQARRLDPSGQVNFIKSTVDTFATDRQWQVVVAVDLIQPNEPKFFSIFEKVCTFVKPGGHLLAVNNYIEIDSFMEFFNHHGFSCLGSQLTGGFQQGLAGFDEFVDWTTKRAYHFTNRRGLDKVTTSLSSDMSEFADYANFAVSLGEPPLRELNRSYFLARLAAGDF